ncbi:MAG: S8 family serine peptidase, partial [bacterium]
VIDTGIDFNHPDLIPNLILPQINVREDGMTDILDDSGHGTAVMGVIGGVGNNQIGVAGINWTVSIVPIRAAGGPFLDCDLFDEVEGIDAAREAGVNVINLSIGGLGTISVERTAVTAAYNAGIVICSAAGNANPGVYYKATGDLQTDWQNLYYPAALPEVIGVGAVTNEGVKADFSNYGEDILSVMAPGVDIITTVPDYECYLYTGEGPPYGKASGTSFATPMVAGVAALILSHYPGLSPDDVRARIEGSATPMTGPDDNHNGVDDYYGYGILNAEGALSQSPTAGNQYMRVAMFQSPTFPSELVIMVKALVTFDKPPTIDWSIKGSSTAGSFTLNEVETRPLLYIGRITPGENGIINIIVNAIHEGSVVTPVRVSRTFSDE